MIPELMARWCATACSVLHWFIGGGSVTHGGHCGVGRGVRGSVGDPD